MSKIERNSVVCLKCEDEIESRTVPDLVSCSCGNIAINGGRDYLRRVAKSDLWQETSIETYSY